MSNKVNVVDCTLRDGGYYCNWDFSNELIKKYLAAVAIAKISVIEIGFRFLPKSKFLGAFAYSTDEYLSTLVLPDNVQIAVMVNAKELVNYQYGVKAAIARLFIPKKFSKVDVVRVATNVHELDSCEEILMQLCGLGYKVMLNIMQISLIDENQLSAIASKVSKWKCVEVLYFADSLGNMDINSIKTVVTNLKRTWEGCLGFHAHDNKGYALSNCMESHKLGVNYLDGTILGMGRGAGNVKTENLLVEMVERELGEFYPDALFPLVLQDFKYLQEKYEWGPNIYYFLSAVHGIHPTYIQELLGNDRYETEHILSAISFLKSTSASFFSFDEMLRAISGVPGEQKGTWSAKSWVENRNVLIIGSGPSVKKYIADLEVYIKNNNPIVFCLNINQEVPEKIVTAYIACHETRILIESDNYSRLNKSLIIPLSRIPEGIKNSLDGLDILDYGLRVEDNSFHVSDNGCTLSSPLALMYAICVASAGGANKILLAGMDGFSESDPRQIEITEMLHDYAELEESLPIISVTPTTYPVQKSSIYESRL